MQTILTVTIILIIILCLFIAFVFILYKRFFKKDVPTHQAEIVKIDAQNTVIKEQIKTLNAQSGKVQDKIQEIKDETIVPSDNDTLATLHNIKL